ncbi:class II fumarate hydratase [Bowmanella denitrificans]|uniref:class II fumarate hydratase n=1 Tax=Bowmanella denitrificans TaxID=366582 RepID=UPI000C9AD7CC|nr:class II fumarate hydratase [Bowmanella denitrificans]
MKQTRMEKDSMGELQVPADALYGAQTQRAVNNFNISQRTMPPAFIRALLQVKAAAAKANKALDTLPARIADTICEVCDSLQQDRDLRQHFPVDVFQTGSGTSTNMNANEVIAKLASDKLGETISANDHVNCSQSSNDVIPTTIHVSAALAVHGELLPALQHLSRVLEEKAGQVKGYCKTGRTHLMDAMPVRLDQTLGGWQAQIQQNIRQLQGLLPELLQVAQGGTAVGTGVNAHVNFARLFCEHLSQTSGLLFKPGDNLFALIATQDTAVALSGAAKTTAVSLMKIANDLRWMNSGPLAGLGEISLPALQPGSSIMPGKVNPVIPEAVAMAAAQVMGNDVAIGIGGQSGNFELNVMLPMIAANLLDSLALLSSSATHLADKAIAGFTVNGERLEQALHRNPILVTALNPVIGYLKAADIAKQAYQQQRPIVDVAEEQTDLSREELQRLLNPVKLTDGGI